MRLETDERNSQLRVLAVVAHLVAAVHMLYLQSHSERRTQNVVHLGIHPEAQVLACVNDL